jgi:hypothetical protein
LWINAAGVLLARRQGLFDFHFDLASEEGEENQDRGGSVMFIRVTRVRPDVAEPDDTDDLLLSVASIKQINRNADYETLITFNDGGYIKVAESMFDIEHTLEELGVYHWKPHQRERGEPIERNWGVWITVRGSSIGDIEDWLRVSSERVRFTEADAQARAAELNKSRNFTTDGAPVSRSARRLPDAT